MTDQVSQGMQEVHRGEKEEGGRVFREYGGGTMGGEESGHGRIESRGAIDWGVRVKTKVGRTMPRGPARKQ